MTNMLSILLILVPLVGIVMPLLKEYREFRKKVRRLRKSGGTRLFCCGTSTNDAANLGARTAESATSSSVFGDAKANHKVMEATMEGHEAHNDVIDQLGSMDA